MKKKDLLDRLKKIVIPYDEHEKALMLRASLLMLIHETVRRELIPPGEKTNARLTIRIVDKVLEQFDLPKVTTTEVRILSETFIQFNDSAFRFKHK